VGVFNFKMYIGKCRVTELSNAYFDCSTSPVAMETRDFISPIKCLNPSPQKHQ